MMNTTPPMMMPTMSPVDNFELCTHMLPNFRVQVVDAWVLDCVSEADVLSSFTVNLEVSMPWFFRFCCTEAQLMVMIVMQNVVPSQSATLLQSSVLILFTYRTKYA